MIRSLNTPAPDGNGHAPRAQAASRPRGSASLGVGPVLITGGAGFIGTNVAARCCQEGQTVHVYDNLSRPGVARNLAWLRETFGDRIRFTQADVRDAAILRKAVRGAGCVFHFAAQVAVTTSLIDPVEDFEINARGTLNVLEACRAADSPPPLLFTSTNKVYGGLDDVSLTREDGRYLPVDRTVRRYGVSERRSLDFHSPYGCSKGTADQYVLDYARCYGMPTVVFRMSCIYGPHQCGTEDQGWVAHFVRQMLHERPITFYGDGRQVRDLLFVEDLVRAMLTAVRQIDVTRGRAFNMGGGPSNAASLLDVMDHIGRLHESKPEIDHGPWRQGDQRYYVSDTRTFQRTTGWRPQVGVGEGIERLYRWLRENEHTLTAATA